MRVEGEIKWLFRTQRGDGADYDPSPIFTCACCRALVVRELAPVDQVEVEPRLVCPRQPPHFGDSALNVQAGRKLSTQLIPLQKWGQALRVACARVLSARTRLGARAVQVHNCHDTRCVRIDLHSAPDHSSASSSVTGAMHQASTLSVGGLLNSRNP